LIDPQPKNPPTVERLTNQLNTVSAPDEMFMRASKENMLENATATQGRPLFVHFVKTLGACPRRARPYRIRDEQKRNEFAALNALVVTPALMMLGRTLIPALVIAMT